MHIKIIISIGNYCNNLYFTRHNVGIWLINKIINNNYFKNIKFGTLYNWKINKKKIYIYCPKTYINNVGKYIYKICKKLKIKNQEILIIHDDINRNPGMVKIKYKINKNITHNGIKNILYHFNKNNFYHINIGIGKPKKKINLKKFVLSIPKKFEIQKICKSIDKSIKYIKLWIKNKKFTYIQNLLNSNK